MDFKSSVQAIYYITTKRHKSLDHWTVLKLIFFADRYHLRKYGRTVTDDNYFAMQKGPVPSTVYDIIKGAIETNERSYVNKFLQYKNKNKNITFTKKGLTTDSLSETDVEALDFALNTFDFGYPGDISNISHIYPEWNKYENGYDSNPFARYPMNINDFFLDPDQTGIDSIPVLSKGKLNNDPFDVISKEIVSSSKDIYQGLL